MYPPHVAPQGARRASAHSNLTRSLSGADRWASLHERSLRAEARGGEWTMDSGGASLGSIQQGQRSHLYEGFSRPLAKNTARKTTVSARTIAGPGAMSR